MYNIIISKTWRITRETMYIQRNIEERSRNHCSSGKAISIKYIECVCNLALVIQHEKNMLRITFSSVAFMAVSYFCILSHIRQDFRENDFLNIKCMFRFSLQVLSDTFPSLWRNQLDIIITVKRLHVKYPLLCTVMKVGFSRNIFEKYSNIRFNASPYNGRRVFHADRWTDRHDESNSRFSQFCERA
jgi:hypothetical protein